MAALTRFLLLCAAVLALPTIASAQPSSFMFQVESTQGWKTTSLGVQRGQKFSFSAVGQWNVDYRNFSYVGPEGYSPGEDGRIYQGCKLDSTLPYGVLLVRIGDDPNFQVVGRGGDFVASYDGLVSFRIHDGDACLGDNAGSVKVTITAAEFPTVAEAPFFVCLSGPRSACQGEYSPPVQDPRSSPPPEWLTSPEAVKCLASITDKTPIGDRLIPRVGKVPFTGIEEIEFFETFYTRAIDRGIPVTWDPKDNDKYMKLYFLSLTEAAIDYVVKKFVGTQPKLDPLDVAINCKDWVPLLQ